MNNIAYFAAVSLPWKYLQNDAQQRVICAKARNSLCILQHSFFSKAHGNTVFLVGHLSPYSYILVVCEKLLWSALGIEESDGSGAYF